MTHDGPTKIHVSRDFLRRGSDLPGEGPRSLGDGNRNFPIPDRKFSIPDSVFAIPDREFPISDLVFAIPDRKLPIPDSRAANPFVRFRVRPVRLARRAEPFDDEEWIFELKGMTASARGFSENFWGNGCPRRLHARRISEKPCPKCV